MHKHAHIPSIFLVSTYERISCIWLKKQLYILKSGELIGHIP